MGVTLRLYCKVLKAFVQFLLFAEISQRPHSIVGGLVSRFQVFVPKKLLNFFFSFCLKVFSYQDCKKIIFWVQAGTNLPQFQGAQPFTFTILQAFPLYKAYMLGFGQVHEGS